MLSSGVHSETYQERIRVAIRNKRFPTAAVDRHYFQENSTPCKNLYPFLLFKVQSSKSTFGKGLEASEAWVWGRAMRHVTDASKHVLGVIDVTRVRDQRREQRWIAATSRNESLGIHCRAACPLFTMDGVRAI